MASVGVISVEIEARLQKLEAGLRQAEARVHQTRDRIEKSSSINIFGKSADQLGKAFIGLKAIELVMGSIGALTEAMAGNWDKAGEFARSVPIFGQIADLAANTLASLMGWNTQIAHMVQEQKRLTKEIAESQSTQSAIRQSRERTLRLREDSVVEQTGDPVQKRLLELDIQFRRQKDELFARGLNPQDQDAELRAIEAAFSARRSRITGEAFADFLEGALESAMDDVERMGAQKRIARQEQIARAEELIDIVRFREQFANELDRKQKDVVDRSADRLSTQQVIMSRTASTLPNYSTTRNPQIDKTNQLLSEIRNNDIQMLNEQRRMVDGMAIS